MKYLLEFESEREMDDWAKARVQAIKNRSRKTKPPVSTEELGPRQQAVLKLLSDGKDYQTKEISEAVKIPGPNVSSVLRSLESRLLVQKVRWGVWRVHESVNL